MNGREGNTWRRFLPVAVWAAGYRRKWLRGDVLAGVTTAAMLVPQAMAYALLMDLPVIVGLYAAMVPLAAYATFGPTRQLSVGPESLVCLISVTALRPLAGADDSRYLALVVATTLVSGVVLLVMAAGRLGFLVNFLSDPVITGFTAGAAVTVIAGQLGPLLGFPVPGSKYVATMLGDVVNSIGAANPWSLALGAGALALMLTGARLRPTFPALLAVVGVATAVVWAWGLDADGVRVVGHVPRTFPVPALPRIPGGDVGDIVAVAVAVAAIGFVQSISVARIASRRNRERLDPTAELVGLGLTNVISGLFQSYPVSGGLSRSAVNIAAGARTQLASLVAAGAVALTLAFFTPALAPMPKSVLAALVIFAVLGMLHPSHFRRIARLRPSDGTTAVAAFAATVLLGVEVGIVVAVAISLLNVIRRTVRPEVVMIGRLPGTTVYRSIDRNPQVRTVPGLVMMRIGAPLYFANTTFVVDTIYETERASDPPLWALILDCRAVTTIDATAGEALLGVAEDLRRRGVVLGFSTLIGPAIDALRRVGVVDVVGEEHLFLNNDAAVEHLVSVHESGARASPACGPA